MFKELSAELMDVLVVESAGASVDGLALPADIDWPDAIEIFFACCCCCGSSTIDE